MPSRRFVSLLLAAALALAAGAVAAAPPVVEIIAMPHPPVNAALKPLRTWLAEQGTALSVTELHSESDEGRQRLAAVGLQGHIPVLILIDGQYRFRRSDGTSVAFVNFPDRPESPPGVRGNWRSEDVEAVLKGHMQ